MPRDIKIGGFRTGKTVEAALSSNGQTVASGPITYGVSFAPVLRQSKTSGVAPLGVHFKLEGLDDDAFKHALVKWDFGDTGAVFSALSPGFVHGNDANTAYGPISVHTYENIGTHRGKVEIWLSAKPAPDFTINFSTAVSDPADQFFGGKTICVDPSGNFIGAPAGAIRYENWDSLGSALNNWTGERRVLFPRGAEVPVTNANNANRVSSPEGDLYFGVFGPGTQRATLSGFELWFTSGLAAPRITVSDIFFSGGWDEATETGADIIGIKNAATNSALTVHNCRFSGRGQSIFMDGDSTAFHNDFVCTNNDFVSYRNYHISGAMGDFGVAGCRLARDPLARGGGDPSKTKNAHTPIRNSEALPGSHCYFQLEFFSNAGWTIASGRPSHQPCVRLVQNSRSPFEMIFNRSVCEGGATIVSINKKNTVTGTDNGARWVIESLLLVGTANTRETFTVGVPTGVLRNNVMVVPDVPSEAGNFDRFIREETGLEPVISGRIEVVHNQVINLKNTSNGGNAWLHWADLPKFPNVTVAGNMWHKPNIDNPRIAASNLDETPVYSAKYEGLNWSGEPQDGTFATKGTGIGLYRPLANSDALDSIAVDADTPLMDFFFNQRSGPTTAPGAFHTHA